MSYPELCVQNVNFAFAINSLGLTVECWPLKDNLRVWHIAYKYSLEIFVGNNRCKYSVEIFYSPARPSQFCKKKNSLYGLNKLKLYIFNLNKYNIYNKFEEIYYYYYLLTFNL